MRNLLVLMHTHQVEPVVLLLTRLEELDFAIPKSAEKSFVSHIAHSVQCKLSASLLQ